MVLGTLRAVLGAIWRIGHQAGPAIDDAYLEDFMLVPAVDRVVAVEARGRVVTVAAVDRWIGVLP